MPNVHDQISQLRLLIDDAQNSIDQRLDAAMSECQPAVDYAVAVHLLNDDNGDLSVTPTLMMLISQADAEDVKVICEWAAGVLAG